MESNPESIQEAHERSLIRKLLDSPIILLIISLLVVFSSYTVWGVIELARTPLSNLP